YSYRSMAMKIFFLVLLTVATAFLQQQSKVVDPVGRWQVKFTLIDSSEKNLIFTAQEKGEGTFQLLDTGPDNKPVEGLQAAAWSLTDNTLSFSGEVELPVGNCCRQAGTLIFKSKLNSPGTTSGRLIFVTNIEEDESPYKYHSTVGTFTASRLK
ncbi:MAG TPA: hypothetical protein VFR78_23395, partial [Pyrinomonadaceae bacterium]|nr:hypothetical protein [Pyrinomonadaceae bacterium]